MHKILLFLLPLLFLACSSDSSSSHNTSPIANAGLYQYASTGSTITLDGSASSDADGDTLTYRWSFISIPPGSSTALLFAETVSPRFTADVDGDYVIKLIVNDGQVDSEPAYVIISTITFVDPSDGPHNDNEIFTLSNTLEQRPMLVIRLEFNDQTFVSDEVIWQQILFGTQTGELNHYYHEISHDQFEFTPVAHQGNVVNGITTITFNDNIHPDPDINSDTFTQDLHPYLKSAIEAVDNSGFDFAAYDTDGNKDITPDELIITFIMAGEEDAFSGGTSANGVWAHQYCTSPQYTPTTVNGISVMGCDKDGNYAIFGERHRYSAANSHDATVGIIAHELGHSAFALPDLYKTVYPWDGGIGYYGLMSMGSWGQKGQYIGEPGDTPPHMCAWSKIDVGWYSASDTSSDIYADVDINATGTPNYNIIKTPVSTSSNEYFLVENRGADGYDEGIKVVTGLYGGGIAIWHIDQGTINAKRPSNSVNNNTSHKGVDLEEANGPTLDTSYGDPEKNFYYSGNKTEFTPNTTPNTNLYVEERSFIFFTNISSRSDTMTLRINNPL